jgi:hypothetical protein
MGANLSMRAYPAYPAHHFTKGAFKGVHQQKKKKAKDLKTWA